MKSGGKFIIGILALVVCGILAVVFWPEKPEPVYKGKKLSEWVVDFNDGVYFSSEATEAIRAIGTNGIPVYLRWLRHKPSRLKDTEWFIAVRCYRWFGLRWNVDPDR